MQPWPSRSIRPLRYFCSSVAGYGLFKGSIIGPWSTCHHGEARRLPRHRFRRYMATVRDHFISPLFHSIPEVQYRISRGGNSGRWLYWVIRGDFRWVASAIHCDEEYRLILLFKQSLQSVKQFVSVKNSEEKNCRPRCPIAWSLFRRKGGDLLDCTASATAFPASTAIPPPLSVTNLGNFTINCGDQRCSACQIRL